jgi:predicted TIM-barrel fold metal-dependent hydrolase
MIIDTEVHVFRFARSTYNNPDNKAYGMHQQFTWREQPADLLVAEMNNAGVDKAFLISYDAEDGRWEAGLSGYEDEDFSGGRKYTLREASKFPDRFLWFNTLKDPKVYDSAAMVRRDAEMGMVGVKLFPAFIRAGLLDEGLRKVWDACQELDLRVLISFENIRPPQTTSLPDYMTQLDELAKTYPGLKFALLHVGCADPLTPAFEDVVRTTRNNRNIYLSTAFPGEKWDDGTEYPFPNYLQRIERTVAGVGADRVMWATDWPWFDWAFKYQQGLNAVRKHAPFLSDAERELVLGETAVEFMGSRINDRVNVPAPYAASPSD